MVFAAAASVVFATPVTAHAQDPGAPDEIEEWRYDEAAGALAAGEWDRARALYQIILRTRPNDARAMRESGRAAHAAGKFDIAIDELNRANDLAGGVEDPELHYLLGEAYYAVDRVDEARREHEIAEREIGASPSERMPSLWLARIYARRGEVERAADIYRQLAGGAWTDAEVVLSWAEAYTLSHKWSRAEKLLRSFLAESPRSVRGREMLAWVLEAQRKIAEETELREALLDEAEPNDFTRTLSHARALERRGDLRGALAGYREAHRIDPDAGIAASIDRMHYRLTTELAVGALVYDDPSGASYEMQTGFAVPLAQDIAASLRATIGMAEGAGDRTRGAMVTAAFAAGYGDVVASILRVSGNYRELDGEDLMPDSNSESLGVGAEVRVAEGRAVQLHARADLHMPWREAANTIREGGTYDGLTAHLYVLPFGHRVVVDTGVQWRSMTLAPRMDVEADGSQLLAFAGADWVVWSDPTSVARGQILDEDLAWPTYLADSFVLSYRHFEAFTDDNFAGRIVLAERDQIDEVSATVRKAVSDGRLGFEGRGGVGYDRARDVDMWRAGGALLISPTASSRFSLLYDVANESSKGFVGRRHAAWVTLHVDL